MKEQFIERSIGSDRLEVIGKANAIIEEYQSQGLVLTLRQLYYQFVSKVWIDNDQKAYKRLGNIISEGRLAGLIDWNAIEDRGRVPQIPFVTDGTPEDVVRRLKKNGVGWFADKWMGQHTYVELWVEKQALAGVLEPLADRHAVTLMVNKGYSSSTAMYDSANRINERVEEIGADRAVILYLGDHDPSGEHMVTDIRQRMGTFRCEVDVEKVALTIEQVRQHRLPPNPVGPKPGKKADPRMAEYVRQFGRKSWEVDALEPHILQRLIDQSILRHKNQTLFEKVVKREAKDRSRLRRALKKIKLPKR